MVTNSTLWIAGVIILVIAFVAWIIFSRKKSLLFQVPSYANEQIYVGNLPYHICENDLRNYFSQFGLTQSVRIIRNFKTGRSKGYAFITYSNVNEARAALYAHGKDMQGRLMVVRIAKPRQE